MRAVGLASSDAAESSLHANPKGEEHVASARPFDISKRLVWQAWRTVRSNRGAAGADEQSLDLFERDLKNNLYRLCNPIGSGSYFPPPVREVLIPKKSGGQPATGHSDGRGRVAQAVANMVLEAELEISLP